MNLSEHTSPKIEALRRTVSREGAGAVGAFWDEIARAGSPLIEALPGEEGHVLVTFVWRAAEGTDDVMLLGGWHGYHGEGNRLTRLEDTDVWHRSYRMRSDTQATYHFLPDDRYTDAAWPLRMAAARPDPWNARTLRLPADSSESEDREMVLSVFALPDAPAETEKSGPKTGDEGEWATLPFLSRVLDNERQVHIYTPPNYAESGVNSDLLILFDGFFFRHGLHVGEVFDQTILAGDVPPLIAVLIDYPDGEARGRELHCSPRFAEFLARELIPWIRERYRVSPGQAGVTVAGSSHGGLAAAYAALTYPETFGNVLSMSGKFEWSLEPDGEHEPASAEHEALARQAAALALLDLRWYLSVGVRETWLGPSGGPNRVVANRHFRTVLQAKGYTVQYREFETGHDYLYWRDALALGLKTLAHNDWHAAPAQPPGRALASLRAL